MRHLRRLALLALATAALSAQAGTLSTNTLPDNGRTPAGSGIFLDLTNLTASSLISVTGFETYASSFTGSAWAFDVYTRAGSYVGNDDSIAGWTLATTASGTSAGRLDLGSLTLASSISVAAGQTTGVYLIMRQGGFRYTDSDALSQRTFSNSELQLFSDRVRSDPFGGESFTPRTFAGNVNYTGSNVSGVPGPAAALAFGVGLIRRRKKA